MATFTNQATLSYRNLSVLSNVAVGEYTEVLAVNKAVSDLGYLPEEPTVYTIGLTNAGTTAITGLTVTDTLGQYTIPGSTTVVYPLTYVEDSVMMLQNGVAVAAPIVVSSGTSLSFQNISVPAEGNTVIVYQATPNAGADPSLEGTISNTVTVTGTPSGTPLTASATSLIQTSPVLSVDKSIDPVPVTESGTLTYTFTISNTGNTAAVNTDNITITDTFSPVLQNITVTLDGATLTPTTQYTYTNGTFATVPGVITVPAAAFTQNPTTGAYTTTPGTAVLTVSGTV